MFSLRKGVRKSALAIAWLSLVVFLFPVVQAQISSFPKGESPLAGVKYVENQLIIKFADNIVDDQKEQVRKKLNSVLLRELSLIGAELIQISGMSVEEAIDSLKRDVRVRYAEPNFIWHADIIPNDPFFNLLWGMHNTGQTGGTVDADIDAVEAWNISTGDSVVIGVIDTGVDTAHVDLLGNIWTNPGEIPNNGIDDEGNGYVDDIHGWDFVNWDNGPVDDNGHGTHVSGTIAGVGNNAIGVAGVCWSARIMALKFLDSWGYGNTADAILAVEYAIRMGANLTSNSWGGGSFSQALKDAIDSSGAHGMLFVAAAGNDGQNNDINPHYPSSYDLENIIAVAATDHNDNLADEPTWASCWGPTSVDLGAPGVNVYSTLPGNSYASYGGTSMATPHVSGAAALIWSKYPSLTHLLVKDRIMDMADPVPDLAGKCVTGGRLNVFMAIAEPDSVPPSPITDLAVIMAEGSRITLSWTATGDDSSTGTASFYDVRYSLNPIDSSNFALASQASGEPQPQPAGSTETFIVTGLNFSTTYYFAVKALDEWGNPSGISNSPSGTTLGPPDISVYPESLSADLFTGEIAVETLTISNSGVSDLEFQISITEPGGSSASVDFIADEKARSAGIIAYGKPVPLDKLKAGLQKVITLGSENLIDKNGPSEKGSVDSPLPQKVTGVEIFGNMDNVYFAGPRTRGNLFTCTNGTTLIEHRLYMNPSASTQLWFLVYEGSSQTGLYNLVSASDVSPAGPGEGWYSSGDINVALAAGKYYLIVASFQQQSNYYNQQSISPYPIPASFGFLTAGAGWNWAPTSNFPPDPTQSVPAGAFGDPVAYYQAIVTGVGTSWLSVNPDSGTIPASSSMDIAVELNAEGLNGGDYYANVAISSNDPDETLVSVPAHLHVTGAPDIVVSDDTLDFGIVYIGYPESLPVLISNEGTDNLTVTNIVSDVAQFTADLTSFTLAPDEDTVVNVTFTPIAVGDVWATLTISSNDPDESAYTIALSGSARECPDLAFSPENIVDSLFTGEIALDTVYLKNEGMDTLVFSFPSFGAAKLLNLTLGKKNLSENRFGFVELGKEELDMRKGDPVVLGGGGPDSSGYTWIDSDEPGGPVFNYIDISGTGTLVTGLQDDNYVGPFPIGFSFKFYDSSYTQFYIQSNGVINFDNLYISLSNQPIPQVDLYNNLIAWCWDDLYGFTGQVYYQQIGDKLVVQFVGYGEFGGPGTVDAEVILYQDGRILIQYDNFNSGFDVLGSTVGIENALGTDGLQVVFNAPYLHNDLAVLFSKGAKFITGVSPVSGRIPSGDSLAIEVTLSAEKMMGGDYIDSLKLSSNDCDNPDTSILVLLHVTGAPDIEISDESLDFSIVYIGYPETIPLEVSNQGTDSLRITGIVVDAPEFSFNLTSFVLPVGKDTVIEVTFTPVAVGEVWGTLIISSDDPDEPTVNISLRGEGLNPPSITVTPDSFMVSVPEGDSTTRIMTIGNIGLGDLNWEISGAASSSLNLYHLPEREIEFKDEELKEPGDLNQEESRSITDRKVGPLNVLLADLTGKMIGITYYSSYSTIIADLQARGGITRSVTFPLNLTFLDSLDVLAVDDAISSASPSDIAAIRTWLQDGKGLLIQGDDAYININALLLGTGISETYLGTYYYAILTNILPHPTTVGVDSINAASYGAYFTITSPAQTIVFDDMSRPHVAVSGLGAGRIVTTANEISDNYNISGVDTRLFSNQVFDWLAAGSFLSVNPSSGTLGPSQTQDVTVKFNAKYLIGGDYTDKIVINNNDPANNPKEVPVHLHVIGIPDISLIPVSIDFETTFVGYSKTDTLWVKNTGSESLIVSSVTSNNPVFSAIPTSFSVPRFGERFVLVTFMPSTAGEVLGTLTITSDDPDEPIVSASLRGVGIYPPDIFVSPDSLSQVVVARDTVTDTLTIYNTGNSPLIFDLSIQEPGGAFASVNYMIEKSFSSTDVLTANTNKNLEFANQPLTIWEANGIDEVTYNRLLKEASYIENQGKELFKPFGDMAANNAPKALNSSAMMIEDFDRAGPWPWSPWVVVISGGSVSSTCAHDGPQGLSDPDWHYRTDVTVGLSGDKLSLWVKPGTGRSYMGFGASSTGAWSLVAAPNTSELIIQQNLSYSYLNLISVPQTWLTGTWYKLEVTFGDSGLVTGRVYGPDGTTLLNTVSTTLSGFHPAGVAIRSFLGFCNDTFEKGESFTWLSAFPMSGSIPAGSSMKIAVTFTAPDTICTDYSGELVISSNDPDEREVTVPVKMRVVERGDVNADCKVDISDVVYMINYVLKSGPEPKTLPAGDVNCDGAVNISDLIYLIERLFKNQPEAC